MTYTAFEQSIEDGSPVELYKFENQLEVFTYTSGNEPIDYMARTYAPIAIKRSEPTANKTVASSKIAIEIDPAAEVATRYISAPPDSTDSVTIYRFHTLDLAVPEVIQWWTGTIASVAFNDGIGKIEAVPSSAAFLGVVPRRNFSFTCNHVLYDGLCGVDKQAFRSDVIITSVSADRTVIGIQDDPGWVGTAASTFLAADAPFFNAGYVELGSSLEFRMIIDVAGVPGDMTLQFPLRAASVGQTVSIFAGCDHFAGTCYEKFDNIANYGGFPYVPNRNPFVKGVGT